MRRILRVTRRLAVVLIAAFLIWTLTFNLFLNTSLLARLLNRSQDDVFIRHGLAWSLWPTQLFVHDLEIHGQDSAVEWMLSADSAQARFDLPGLLEKKLTLSDARANGVAFRLRQTRPLDALCQTEALPELPRLANAGGPIEECLRQKDTSKKPGGPPRPENMWRVDLRGIEAKAVREVWVEAQRFTGDAALNGDFYFWPTVRVGLPRLAFEITKGSVASGAKPLIEQIDAGGEAVLLPVELAEGSAPLLDKLSVTTTVSLQVASVGFLNDQFSGPAGVSFDQGIVALKSRMKIVGGEMRPGTTIDISARDLRARMLDHVALGSGRVNMQITAEKTGSVEAVLDEFRLEYVDDPTAPILGNHCSLVLSTRGTRLTEQFQITSARFELGSATVADLSRFNRYIPKSERLKIKKGSATLSGTFAVGADQKTETAEVRLSFADVLATWKQFDVRGAGDFHALGRVDVAPIPRLSLKRLAFNLRGGSISAGRGQGRAQDSLTSGLNISGVASLGSIAFAELEEKLLHKLVLDARVAADVRSLRSINKHLMNTTWLAFERGSGRVEGRLRLAGGRLLPGSHFSAASDLIVARIFDHQAIGSGFVGWTLDPQGAGELMAALDQFELRRIGFEQTHVRGEELRIALETAGHQVSRPFEVVGARLTIDRAMVPDLTFYNTYIPRSMDMMIAEGSATVSGELYARTSGGGETGSWSLKTDSVLLQWRNFDIRGAVLVDGSLKVADLNKGIFDVGGTRLRMQDVTVAAAEETGKPAVEGWWGEVELSDAEFQIQGPMRVAGTVKTHLRDIRPLLTIYGAEAGLPKWTHGLLAANDTRGSCRVRLGDQRLVFEDVDLFGGGLRARAHAQFDDNGAQAAALLGYGAFSVGAELENGETSFNIFNPTKKFQEREKMLRESARAELVN